MAFVPVFNMKFLLAILSLANCIFVINCKHSATVGYVVKVNKTHRREKSASDEIQKILRILSAIALTDI